ncbi:MAG: IS5/IS1182 family transposase, partial [Nitrospirae bacterium]|nr:IS5/IS1182 family transposase [Candidatus Manganitrophaceae bacterium]
LYYVGESCQSCEQKILCTKSKNPRRITRCPEEGSIDRIQLRMQQHPEIMKKRKAIVEHPFGTIKFWNHQNAFLMRGLEKVLSTLAYNMKRVIKIVGVKKMIEALA